MPELPEVETIRRELEHEIVGRRIKAVQVLPGASRSIRRHADALEFQTGLDGHKLTGIGRRGKYLLFNLDTGSILVVHLGMSGQLLLIKSNKEPPSRHTRVTLLFSQGGELRFVDPRTFGEMFVTRPEKIEEDVPELAHLGFDPLMQVMSWTRFATMLQQHSGKLKPLLMDQRFVAGIGNIYADEILFAAGLRYDREADSLSSQEVRRLYRAMLETLGEAVRQKGSSLADEQYRDIFGELGSYQSQHAVYAREGQPCRRCRSVVVRVRNGGRSSYLCERCQV